MLSNIEKKRRRQIQVQLVQPPLWAYNLPPLGIAYLAGALRHEEMTVRVQEFNRGFFLRMKEDIQYLYRQMDTGTLGLLGEYPEWHFNFSRIETLSPEKLAPLQKTLAKKTSQWGKRLAKWGKYICFSVHNTSLAFAQILAQEIRRKNPKQIIIFGGPEIDRHHYNLLEKGAVDYFIQGEGEEALVRLLLELEAGKPPTPYRGLTFYQEGQLIEGHGNTGQSDINRLSFPDFSDFFLPDYNYPAALPMLSSRSCVARCTFCAEPGYWGAFRQREPEHVLEEMAHHYKKYKIRIYYFCDSLINGSVPWMVRLAEQIAASPLDIYWGGNSRISYRMDPEALEKLQKGGLRFLYFGIESGSQEILNKMKKGVLKKTMRQVLKDTHDAGIWVHTYWILGFPGETSEHVIETAEFLLQEASSIDSFNFSNFFPKDDLKVWPDYVEARDHPFDQFLFWDEFYRILMMRYFERINNYFELKYWLMNRDPKKSRLEETETKQQNRLRVRTIFSFLRTLHQYFAKHHLKILREVVPESVQGESILLRFTHTSMVLKQLEAFLSFPPKEVFLAYFPTSPKKELVSAVEKLLEKGISVVFPGAIPTPFQSIFGIRNECDFCFHLFQSSYDQLDDVLSHLEQELWKEEETLREKKLWGDWVYQELVQKVCPHFQKPLLISASPSYNHETL